MDSLFLTVLSTIISLQSFTQQVYNRFPTHNISRQSRATKVSNILAIFTKQLMKRRIVGCILLYSLFDIELFLNRFILLCLLMSIKLEI